MCEYCNETTMGNFCNKGNGICHDPMNENCPGRVEPKCKDGVCEL